MEGRNPRLRQKSFRRVDCADALCKQGRLAYVAAQNARRKQIVLELIAQSLRIGRIECERFVDFTSESPREQELLECAGMLGKYSQLRRAAGGISQPVRLERPPFPPAAAASPDRRTRCESGRAENFPAGRREPPGSSLRLMRGRASSHRLR